MSRHDLGTLTADGSTTGRKIYNSRMGKEDTYNVYVFGTFGSGTVTVETSPDSGTTYVSVGSDGVFTANGQVQLTLKSDAETPVLIRATIAGSTSPDVDITLFDARA